MAQSFSRPRAHSVRSQHALAHHRPTASCLPQPSHLLCNGAALPRDVRQCERCRRAAALPQGRATVRAERRVEARRSRHAEAHVLFALVALFAVETLAGSKPRRALGRAARRSRLEAADVVHARTELPRYGGVSCRGEAPRGAAEARRALGAAQRRPRLRAPHVIHAWALQTSLVLVPRASVEVAAKVEAALRLSALGRERTPSRGRTLPSGRPRARWQGGAGAARVGRRVCGRVCG